MNKRIKQLYDEAVNYTASQDDGTKNQLQMNHVCADKFAELIVKECMSITDKCSTGPGLHDLFADNIIAEHFGVEE
jgi:hypothetical protein